MNSGRIPPSYILGNKPPTFCDWFEARRPTHVATPLLGLLVWGCVAHADGSWTRWAEVTTSDGRLVEWKALRFYPTKAACERELGAKREKCLPDTADPRGPKSP